MFRKLKTIALAVMLPLVLAAPLALAPTVSAASKPIGDCGGINGSVKQGLNAATGSGTSGSNVACDDSYAGSNPRDLASIAKTVVNLISVVVGVVAVIMIIVGGFRYITSGGDSNRVSGAKNTLIYALVGLIIVALAQFIVHFVLTNVNGG